MHEGSIFHEVRLLHEGSFCTKDQTCTKTHLHGLKTFIFFYGFFLQYIAIQVAG